MGQCDGEEKFQTSATIIIGLAQTPQNAGIGREMIAIFDRNGELALLKSENFDERDADGSVHPPPIMPLSPISTKPRVLMLPRVEFAARSRS